MRKTFSAMKLACFNSTKASYMSKDQGKICEPFSHHLNLIKLPNWF